VNLLARHAAGLRRVLEPARAARTASGMLVWTDPGYLLTVPEGGLDLVMFDRQVGQAGRPGPPVTWPGRRRRCTRRRGCGAGRRSTV
jgi:hypothetical protein